MKKWTENRDVSSEGSSAAADAEDNAPASPLPPSGGGLVDEDDLPLSQVKPAAPQQNKGETGNAELEKARAGVNSSSIDRVVGAFQAEFERSALSGSLNRTEDAMEASSSDVEAAVETPNIPGLSSDTVDYDNYLLYYTLFQV